MLGNQFVTASTASVAAHEVDTRRRLDQQIEARAEEIVRAAFEASPLLAAHVDKAGTIDYATRLSFLTPQVERSLHAQWQSTQQEREQVARRSRCLSLLVPSLGVQTSLARLAGTDLERHRAFEAHTRDFQLELRGMFYTRMHAQIADPTPRPIENSYGRFNFTDYEAIPTFRVPQEDAGARVRGALPEAFAMLVLSVLITVLAAARLRRWPEDL
jgi:ABC-2 type transport system permease protein